ncbi:MAG: tRNA lysidine(34) synthetase TilS [Thermotogaceae bacterium]|nr:tRNA lysidine(34) synthetase TilS [Thermotogaceae bacterium]
MSDVLKKVENFIKEKELIHSGEKVILAISGGMDSMVMLHMLKILSKKICFDIHVAHLDHGIRKNSERDANFVKRICKEWNLKCTIERRNVNRKKGESLEEAARKVRYSYLREVKSKVDAKKIATAHHMLDLAETITYRILRGVGPLSIYSIRAKEGDLIRPLLILKREEIEKYAKEHGIPFVQDETNFDLTIRRNYIRHRIIPIMRTINPSLEESFYRLSEMSSMLKNFIDKEIEQEVNKYVRKLKKGFEFPVPEDPFIFSEMIKRIFENLTGKSPEWQMIKRVISDQKKKKSFKVNFYGNLGVWKSYDKVFVGDLTTEYLEYNLEQGKYEFDDFLITVKRDKIHGSVGIRYVKGMVIRNRQKGDKTDKIKLKDLLINKKVPAYFRDEIPLIAIGKKVVYVASLWVDKKYMGKDFYVKVENSPL